MSRENMPDDRVNQFHVGQVWMTLRGGLWKVVEIVPEGSNYLTPMRHAKMRQGLRGSGRIKRKRWDDVINMVLHYDPEYDEAPIEW